MNDSILNLFEDFVLYDGHPALAGPDRSNRSRYTYPNGSQIVLGSLDHRERLLSSEYDHCCIFQAEETNEADLELLSSRLRRNTAGYHQMILDLNPSHPHHWIKMRIDEGTTTLLHSVHQDNPVYFDHRSNDWTPASVEYMATLKRMKGVMAARLYRGEWAGLSGLVYPSWRRDIHLVEFETKAHVERSVPIPDDLVKVLQHLKAQAKGPYVFLTLNRLATITAKMETGDLRDIFDPINNVLRDFKRIQVRAFRTLAGDHAVGTVHDCWRTYCTVMADVVPPHRLQKLAGHADIKTTLGYYIHTDDANDDQVRSVGLGRPEQDTLRTHLVDSAVIEAA